MYKKILVPLDGSKLAECVLPHVASIIKGCQAPEVIFVRVVEPFQVPPGDFVLSADEAKQLDERHKAEAESYLSRIASQAGYEGAEVKWEVIVGKVSDSLADYVRHSGADIVVMATHGRSGVSRWVFGSVAERVLRSAGVPVLMVRASESAAGG